MCKVRKDGGETFLKEMPVSVQPDHCKVSDVRIRGLYRRQCTQLRLSGTGVNDDGDARRFKLHHITLVTPASATLPSIIIHYASILLLTGSSNPLSLTKNVLTTELVFATMQTPSTTDPSQYFQYHNSIVDCDLLFIQCQNKASKRTQTLVE